MPWGICIAAYSWGLKMDFSVYEQDISKGGDVWWKLILGKAFPLWSDDFISLKEIKVSVEYSEWDHLKKELLIILSVASVHIRFNFNYFKIKCDFIHVILFSGKRLVMKGYLAFFVLIWFSQDHD